MRRKKVYIVVDVNSGVRRPEVARATPRVLFPLARSLALVLVFVVSLFSLGAFQGRAQTVVLHPSVCLGGWEHASRAEGSPEQEAGLAISEETAAFLDAPIAGTIICGKFLGAIPDNTAPQRATVRLFLAPHAGRPEQIPLDTPSVIPVVDAPATPAVSEHGAAVTGEEEQSAESPLVQEAIPDEQGDAPEAPQESLPLEVPSPVLPVQEPETSSTVPEPVTPADGQASSWLQHLVGVAYAAEPEVEASPEQPRETSTELVEPVLEVGAVVPLELFEDPGVPSAVEEPTETDYHGTEEAVVAPTVLGVTTEPFLEVGMSINGEFQEVIATLTTGEIDVVEFELSLPGSFSWEDFEFLEISLTKITGLAAHQAVLLDGMEIVVEPSSTSASGGVVSFEEVSDSSSEYVDAESLAPADELSTEFDAASLIEEQVGESGQDSVVQQSAFKPRVFIEKRNYASHAPFSCATEPFRVTRDEIGDPIALSVFDRDTTAVLLEIGSVPAGLELHFSDSGSYEQRLERDESSTSLVLSMPDPEVRGDFTIPIIATAENASRWSVICQLNIAL